MTDRGPSVAKQTFVC
jgi:hypothetical protein